VRFGNLRRLTPVSKHGGFDRGLPIDRYYIENFLARHAEEIRGRSLEIREDLYTKKFGGDRVVVGDVLDVDESNQEATIIADLNQADHLTSDIYDCIIFTQTLQYIYNASSAVQTLRRILKPGGVLLATLPGISSAYTPADGPWYWRFTPMSARRLFEEAFPASNVEVEAHGNVLAAISFLHGLAAQELRQEELDHRGSTYDGYDILITLRAKKPNTTT